MAPGWRRYFAPCLHSVRELGAKFSGTGLAYLRVMAHLWGASALNRTGRMMTGRKAKAIAIARSEQQKLNAGLVALGLLLLPALLLLLISP